jgi:DNA polymerase-3 subunit delta'
MSAPLNTVRRLAAAGRLSHAYLITGPKGSGRHELARALTQAMVCSGEEKPCGVCSHCKKVLSGIHPDVTTITFPEDKNEILVDQIRAMRADAYILPNEARRKVYIIDPAGGMNEKAQNAFLKVLEEGPAYASFLLIAQAAGEVLVTVASRCEKLSVIPAVGAETEISEDANTLAGLLLDGEESQLQAFCAALEQKKEKDLTPLLEGTLEELRRRCRADLNRAGEILPIMKLIETLLAAAPFHVGAGHLLGWLCAGSRLR